jgi:DNA replication licensing factor MCM3
VRVDGIVTKASLVRPKLTRSVHYCPATKRTISKEYRDALTSSARSLPTGTTYPTKDDDGNVYSTEFGHSVYTWVIGMLLMILSFMI